MSMDNNDAMWIVHGFDFRNDYQNILKQNSVVFHKLLESQVNKHLEIMS